MIFYTKNKKNTIYLSLSFVFVVLLVYFLWQLWPSIVLSGFEWQRDNNARLSQLFFAIQDHETSAYYSLILFSFIYGVIHAVGPGHGKFVISTFVATHPTKVRHALFLTIATGLMQAFVAIAFVSTLLFLFNSSMREVNKEVPTLINMSFGAVVLMGGFIAYKAIRQLIHIHKHHHNDSCHCHEHMDAKTFNHAHSWKTDLGIIFSSGLRPCSGALMVLFFSKVINLYWVGMVSALLMAIGTAITTSAIALLTLSGKTFMQRFISTSDRHVSLGGIYLKMIGGILLMIFGILLIHSGIFSFTERF